LEPALTHVFSSPFPPRGKADAQTPQLMPWQEALLSIQSRGVLATFLLCSLQRFLASTGRCNGNAPACARLCTGPSDTQEGPHWSTATAQDQLRRVLWDDLVVHLKDKHHDAFALTELERVRKA